MPFSAIRDDQWAVLRAKYAYPAVRLVAPSKPIVDAYFQQDEERRYVATDELLENYHRDLLLSEDFSQQRLGAASVSYWGFYGSASSVRKTTPERALSRANNVYRGGPPSDVLEVQLLSQKLKDARAYILADDLRGAFKSYRSLYDIGPSFASKLVAFASPATASVLDKVVCSKLLKFDHPDLQEIGRFFLKTNVGRQADLYDRWCRICQAVAHGLNLRSQVRRSASGDARWRAIDIERAIFSWS